MNDDLARKVRELPALPQALATVRGLMQDDDVTFDQLAAAISHEPSLAADLLRLANSSLYGLAGRVHSVRDAIGVLGLRNLSMLLTAAAIRTSLKTDPSLGFDTLAHWRHGVASGLCAFHLAIETGAARDAAFTAGLLHDLGRLALACIAPEAASAVHALSTRDDLPLLEAERRCLGTDHAAFGAMVAVHWHFGADIVEAIRHHHEPALQAAAADEHCRRSPALVDLVHVADAMVHALDLNAWPQERVPQVDPVSWNRLHLSDEACLQTLERTESQLLSLCSALGVS